MKLHIKRIACKADGVFGVLLDDAGYPLCLTIEDEWKDNKPFVSCIPAGEYTCKRRYSSARQKMVWQVLNVPDREYILIHIANDEEDIEGCIGVGSMFGLLGYKHAVLMSAEAFKKFMFYTKDVNLFKLKITNEWS